MFLRGEGEGEEGSGEGEGENEISRALIRARGEFFSRLNSFPPGEKLWGRIMREKAFPFFFPRVRTHIVALPEIFSAA